MKIARHVQATVCYLSSSAYFFSAHSACSLCLRTCMHPPRVAALPCCLLSRCILHMITTHGLSFTTILREMVVLLLQSARPLNNDAWQPRPWTSARLNTGGRTGTDRRMSRKRRRRRRRRKEADLRARGCEAVFQVSLGLLMSNQSFLQLQVLSHHRLGALITHQVQLPVMYSSHHSCKHLTDVIGVLSAETRPHTCSY